MYDYLPIILKRINWKTGKMNKSSEDDRIQDQCRKINRFLLCYQ